MEPPTVIGSAFLRTPQCERRAKLETSVCRQIWRAWAACRVAHVLRPSHDWRFFLCLKRSATARWESGSNLHFRSDPLR